ncbi:MAG: hypothetical protein HS113_06990 [Verrucomicrobiales bacterium]|nr:hypothetical protein [Verrucomicrobiales bacterium]
MSEQHFEIAGLPLPTLSVAVERALPLLERLAHESKMLCLEAHFLELDGLKRLAQIISSNRFAYYCWGSLGDAAELERPEFQRVSQARFLFENASLLLNPLNIAQPYDWAGCPPETLSVVLELKHAYPLKEEDREPSSSVTRLLADVAAGVLEQKPERPVKTTSLRRDEFRTHQYAITVPVTHAAHLTKELCSAFGLRNGLGSYEFLGTAAECAEIQQDARYRFEGFPENCWSLNRAGPSGRRGPWVLRRCAKEKRA